MLTVFYLFLLFVSIIAILKRNHFLAGLLFTAFITKGLSILPSAAGDLKLTHLSFVFLAVFCLYHRQSIWVLIRTNAQAKRVAWLVFFFFCSVLFSIFYYDFPALDTIQTGLRYFTFTSFFVYIAITRADYEKLFNLLFYITLITGVLYILQCITGTQLLAYDMETFDQPLENGLFRFYNAPPLNGLFIIVSLFARQYIPRRFRLVAPVVFLLVVLLSNGRSAISVLLLQIIVIAFFTGLKKKNIVALCLFGVVFYSVQGLIFQRFDNSGKTSEDIALTLKGDFQKAAYQSENGYTMLYRFAWVHERFVYLAERPWPESLFGLGLLPDEHPIIQKKYNFKYGLMLPDTYKVAQVRTPDIAWGNFLTCYGLIGTIVFFSLYFSLFRQLWRGQHPFAKILGAFMLTALLSAFTGTVMSEPYYLANIFLFYGFYRNYILPQSSSFS